MSRYTVEEAAAVLGMTTGAVRNRLSKGILRSVEEHGAVYVLLPAYYTSRDAPPDTGDMPGMSDAPVSEMRERIALLERELEESGALVSEMRERIAFLEREIAGKDAILTNIAEAVKDISPPAHEEEPSEPPEAPQTATQQPGRAVPQPSVEVEGAQEAQESPAMAMPEAGGRPLPRDQQTVSEAPRRWWKFWR
jgi:uncharacterized small protein (DUF1192 family)